MKSTSKIRKRNRMSFHQSKTLTSQTNGESNQAAASWTDKDAFRNRKPNNRKTWRTWKSRWVRFHSMILRLIWTTKIYNGTGKCQKMNMEQWKAHKISKCERKALNCLVLNMISRRLKSASCPCLTRRRWICLPHRELILALNSSMSKKRFIMNWNRSIRMHIKSCKRTRKANWTCWKKITLLTTKRKQWL